MIQKDRFPKMHASIKTVVFPGIDTIPVKVQVHVANGLPVMVIVGLADKAVAGSLERVGSLRHWRRSGWCSRSSGSRSIWRLPMR